MSLKPKISIVTPFYQEGEHVLRNYRARIDQLCRELTDFVVELVLVDDHSSDTCSSYALQWASEDERVAVLRLAKNSGTHAAALAGLSVVSGDVAVVMAIDLQDPPEVIKELIAKWRNQNKVVWAVRERRVGSGALSTFFAGLFCRFCRACLGSKLPVEGVDFFLLDRQVIRELVANIEKNANIITAIMWLGFAQATVTYQKQSRKIGQSKWTFWRKVKLAVDSIVSTSYRPIRFVACVGLCVCVCGLLYSLYILQSVLFVGTTVDGWSSLIISVTTLGGFQILALSLLGEYIWRIYDEVRKRPYFIVESHQPARNAGTTHDGAA